MSLCITSVMPFQELKEKDGFMECVEEYKKLCITEGVEPEAVFDFTPYEIMDMNNQIICLGIFVDEKCVGFAGLIPCPSHHLGKPFLTVESIFILEQYRGKCWSKTLKHIKEIAIDNCCCGVIVSAQSGSRFDYYMSLKYTPMNTLYWINVHDK